MPAGVPDDFHELIRNINMIDQLKSKISQQYDSMEDQFKDVADLLSDTKMTKA